MFPFPRGGRDSRQPRYWWEDIGLESGLVLSNRRLTVDAASGSGWKHARGYTNRAHRRYAEFTILEFSGTDEIAIGIGFNLLGGSGGAGLTTALGGRLGARINDGCYYSSVSNGYFLRGNSINPDSAAKDPPPMAVGDVIMMAQYESLSRASLWWGKNGTWYFGGDPATDITTEDNLTLNNETPPGGGNDYCAVIGLKGSPGPKVRANFGFRPFLYTPPTGYEKGWDKS